MQRRKKRKKEREEKERGRHMKLKGQTQGFGLRLPNNNKRLISLFSPVAEIARLTLNLPRVVK